MLSFIEIGLLLPLLHPKEFTVFVYCTSKESVDDAGVSENKGYIISGSL